MAPRFKQNMYQTYRKDVGADALICFPFSNDKFIFPFRDKLTEKISSETNLYLVKNEGEPTRQDSWFLFFNSEDDIIFRDEIISKCSIGFWPYIFKTKKYKEFKKEEQKIEQLVKTEIHTSHDYTCVVVNSSIHSEDSLSELIARELNINMPKNCKLPSMKDIICSNRTFDIKTLKPSVQEEIMKIIKFFTIGFAWSCWLFALVIRSKFSWLLFIGGFIPYLIQNQYVNKSINNEDAYSDRSTIYGILHNF